MSEATLVKLSRLVALRRELDVVANNVANSGTRGFKAQRVTFKEYLRPEKRVDGETRLERPVSLVDASTGFMDMSKGLIESTGNRLNVAISGNAYFAVQTAEGERYTRNGAFVLDASGRLVTASGQVVLGTDGPLTLSSSETDVTINPEGRVLSSRGIRGQLKLAAFDAPQRLVPVGGDLFRSDGQPVLAPTPDVRLVPGALERSNVRPVAEMTRLAEITRAYELVATMLKQDEDKDELRKLSDIV